MDKSKRYSIYWDDIKNAWVCESEDFQEYGICDEENLDDKGLAPIFAALDCVGYDVGIIADKLLDI